MTNTNKKWVVLGSVVLVLLLGYVVYVVGVGTLRTFGANALLDANRNPRVWGSDCTVTNYSISAGNYLARNAVATSTLRAWARISVPDNATNTIYANFAQGASSTASIATLKLNRGNGTNGGEATSTPYIDFGLNTDFPYTGTVSVFSETGTSTVDVTECLYESF